MEKICLIYNFAQHYRSSIFQLLDQQLYIDFVFGEEYLNIKKMDYSLLQHKVTEVKTKPLIGSLDWQCGVIKQLFKGYHKFILLGKPTSISTWMVLILGRLMGKKIYFWSHGWYGKESKSKSFIKKLFFGLANGTMTYGNYARNLMIKEGLKAEKITTIHNSLMYDEQISIRETLKPSNVYKEHFKNDNPVIIFIGRLTPIKKLDQIIMAQEICRKNNFNFNIVFIGDGSEKDYLENLAKDHGLINSVWFYGPSYDEKELSNLIFNADLCVAPGNIGLTAMHAMAYGCPCMSHNDFPYQMPEFEAIQEGVTGGFFERDNVESLAENIQKWFENHKFEREQIRKNCYQEIDNKWNPHIQLKLIKQAIGE